MVKRRKACKHDNHSDCCNNKDRSGSSGFHKPKVSVLASLYCYYLKNLSDVNILMVVTGELGCIVITLPSGTRHNELKINLSLCTAVRGWLCFTTYVRSTELFRSRGTKKSSRLLVRGLDSEGRVVHMYSLS